MILSSALWSLTQDSAEITGSKNLYILAVLSRTKYGKWYNTNNIENIKKQWKCQVYHSKKQLVAKLLKVNIVCSILFWMEDKVKWYTKVTNK